jgi:hypothetical protein
MKKFLTALVVLGISASASAMSLKEKTAWEKWNKDMKEGDHYTDFKKHCGKDVTVTLDQKFLASFMKEEASPSGWCGQVLEGMSRLCEDATAKKEVTKITKVNCKSGKPDEMTLKKTGNELTATFGFKTSNISDKTKEYLENNL